MRISQKIQKFRQIWKAANVGYSQFYGGVAVWPSRKKKDTVNAYSENIDVYRVINKVTDAIKSMPLVVYEGRGEDKIQLDDHDVLKLLRRPNRHTTEAEFKAAAISMKMITGDGYINMPIHAEGGNKGRPSEIFVLPSQYMAIVPMKGSLDVARYELTLDLKREFPAEEVIHWKEFNPEPSPYGMSKLFPGSRTVAVSNESQTSLKKAFQNSGATGMFSYDGSKVDGLQPSGVNGQSAWNENWEDQYTGSLNRNKSIWLNFETKYQQIGMSPVDLKTIDAQRNSLDGIAGLFNVPMELVNPEAKQSYQSPKEALKALYTQAAIPEYIQFIDSLNQYLMPLFTDNRDQWIWFDTSGVEALQMDRKAQIEWLERAWWLTPNQRLLIMKMDQSDDPEMDKIWIPQNIVPMSFEDISEPIKQ